MYWLVKCPEIFIFWNLLKQNTFQSISVSYDWEVLTKGMFLWGTGNLVEKKNEFEYARVMEPFEDKVR